MATAQFHGRWNLTLSRASPDKKSRFENLRLCGLPLLTEQADLKGLRVAKKPSRKRNQGLVTAAHTARGSTIDHGYDLYELLGVETDAPIPEIKQAYRWLQKRCHPDIAGPIGHDMSILLNDAYATLQDPMQRAAYDVKRVERTAFDGFTGKPLYSKWLGPEEEDRAIFVDESQCVGCLKCALIASSTFAIENRYGRARAVGQWGNSEATISDAIRACPVDCISFVQRDKLPVLEFVMTKQPRVIVGVDMYSYGGQRNENVFVAAEKFLKRCAERELSKKSNLQETPAQRKARMAAAENIQARAGHWWHHFVGVDPTELDSVRASRGAIVPLSWIPLSDRMSSAASHTQHGPSIPEELGRLFEAARRRRQGNGGGNVLAEDDYWTPANHLSRPVSSEEQRATSPKKDSRATKPENSYASNFAGISDLRMGDEVLSGWLKSALSAIPVTASLIGAVSASMTNGLGAANSSDISSGPLPAEITSGIFMQVFLAAAVWYMIGAVVGGIAKLLIVSAITMRRNKD